VPNRSKLVRASSTFGGGDAPHERPPRRQMHDAGEVESRAHGEDSVEWAGERREGVLTPALPGALAWASSFSGAVASTAMESGAVKDSVPSVLHSCRMSTKNASKTQPLAVFQQSTSTDNNPYLLPRSVLPPHLGYVGCTLSRRQGCMDEDYRGHSTRHMLQRVVYPRTFYTDLNGLLCKAFKVATSR
jgi:hypothetical protein